LLYSNEKWINGTIYRFAGTGIPGYTGDGEKAEMAQLNGPAGLAIDKGNNVYVAEIHNNTIRKIDSKTGIISTVAGCGLKGFEGDGGLAVYAKLNGPEGVFLDTLGNIYIADTYNQRIRRVDVRTGIIETIAGTGERGYNGDNIRACESYLNCPAGVVVDSKGNVYFNDYKNDRIRKINLAGIISTFAGTGIPGYSGDGGPANKAQINDVYGLGIDTKDNVYIMDSLNFAVRKVDADSEIISTVIGQGEPGPIVEFENICNSFIGGPLHKKGTIGMEAPHAVEVDSNGNIFIGDTGSFRIRMVDLERNLVYTVAGNGNKGNSGENGRALNACLGVHGLRIDSENNLFFVDFHNHVIRVVKFD
jgi:sugar lactone lactonase YvrE